jgi:hypothetical protein
MKTKSESKTPSANWANWALINASLVASDATTKAAVADLITKRFVETVSENNHGPRTFVVLTDWGTWGRGATLAEAAAKAVKAGAPRKAKAVATLVLNDAEPTVTSHGELLASSGATLLYLGVVGTLGGILTANNGGAK